MWETILIVVIVIACALFIGRRFLGQIRGKTGCGCSCSGCEGPTPETPSCCEEKKE